jgi:hypothetical protein
MGCVYEFINDVGRMVASRFCARVCLRVRENAFSFLVRASFLCPCRTRDSDEVVYGTGGWSVHCKCC